MGPQSSWSPATHSLQSVHHERKSTKLLPVPNSNGSLIPRNRLQCREQRELKNQTYQKPLHFGIHVARLPVCYTERLATFKKKMKVSRRWFAATLLEVCPNVEYAGTEFVGPAKLLDSSQSAGRGSSPEASVSDDGAGQLLPAAVRPCGGYPRGSPSCTGLRNAHP